MHATVSLDVAPATRHTRPVIVGHRGAPAYRPEHTVASYELAIDQGADLIEPDVVVSRDGALVVRHESELSLSTDIASRPEFAHLRTTRKVNGVDHTGWFVDDLDLDQLRTLRAVEKMPALRPLNTAYDGRYGILTLAEVVDIARGRNTCQRQVGVLAELKTTPEDQGAPHLGDLVSDELRRLGADSSDGPVVIQSFDFDLLRSLRADLGDDGPRMLQLVSDKQWHEHLLSPAGLREVSTYAQGIAPSRHRILLRDEQDAFTGVSDLVDQAHSAGLSVVPWTLRAENAFLPVHLRRGSDLAGIGDAAAEARMLLALGVDGLITDSPDVAQQARAELVAA
jgi:glycerophosphoryl diester phosphodiesterase